MSLTATQKSLLGAVVRARGRDWLVAAFQRNPQTSLTEWLMCNWLTRHKTSVEGIAGLFNAADRDVADSHRQSLSADWARSC